MRGTPQGRSYADQATGITPAHAGNTFLLYDVYMVSRDHPRPCGEHSSLAECLKAAVGSPPPMRGTLHAERNRLAEKGITPAHAGNTHILPAEIHEKQDHPRPCGEHTIEGLPGRALQGSPPPMRGTQHWPDVPIYSDRITPAHAGNTKSF